MVTLLSVLDHFLHIARVGLQVLLAAGLLIGVVLAAEAVHVIHNRLKAEMLRRESQETAQPGYHPQHKKAA